MDKKEFRGQSMSLKDRFMNKLLFSSIVALFLILMFFERLSNLGIALSLLFLLVLLFPIFPIILHSIKWVDFVKMDNDKIVFEGYKFDKRFSKESAMENVTVQIKVDASKWRRDYYLEFDTTDNMIIVNRLQDWDYSTLVQLYREFKSLKNEKVIFDDEYLLNIMEKKQKE